MGTDAAGSALRLRSSHTGVAERTVGRMAAVVRDVLFELQPDPLADSEQGERVMRQLRKSLADLDVDSVRPVVHGEAPEGAKGTDPATLCAIVVAMSASGGVFTAVIDTVRELLARQSARHKISVTIEGDTIELESATAQQRESLVQAFVHRHTAG